MTSPISDFVSQILPLTKGVFSEREVWDETRVSPKENVDISCTLAFKLKSDRSDTLSDWEKSMNLQGLQVSTTYLNWNLKNSDLLKYAKALSQKALDVGMPQAQSGDRVAFLSYFSGISKTQLSDKTYDNPLFTLQYAHAQTCAIFRMQQEKSLSVENLDEKLQPSPEEHALILQAICSQDELFRLGLREMRKRF